MELLCSRLNVWRDSSWVLWWEFSALAAAFALWAGLVVSDTSVMVTVPP